MHTLFLYLLAVLACILAKAQVPAVDTGGSITIKRNNTVITLTPYAENIVKFILQPDGYRTNEMISDAVMPQPKKVAVRVKAVTDKSYNISVGTVIFNVNNDTIFFGDKGNALLAGVFQNEDYKEFRFLLTSREKIFGAGERALPLNRRGYELGLYNQPAYGYGLGAENLNYSVPFITSSNYYALFFDNPSKGYLDIGKSDSATLQYGAFSGALNFYLITGKSFSELLSSYHYLTGRQPLPPRWALGNFLSRMGYTSEEETVSIMQKMEAADIPFDAVIFDLYWFGDSIKGTMGNLDWVNKKAWPDPGKMIKGFKKVGTKTVLVTEPYILTTSLNYEESKKYHAVDSNGNPFVITNFYFGPAGLIDIFRKDSKDWFWRKYKAQMNKGVEGWWGDLGEPEVHPKEVYHNLNDLGFSRLFKADEVHNIYGHYWTKMLFDKYALEYPGKRLFSLNRSGFAGTQRYSIFPWTGDVGRSWRGLSAQLPVILGMSMSGVPFVHSDAGGFAGGGKDPELYVRWLQFAAYTPVFRPHGHVDKETGVFPTEAALFDEPYRSLAKKVVEERYALLPYNYTLAYQQATEGKPLISPLYYSYSNDSNSYKAEDEFMWGENMLVAPVLQKGATTRRLYLPNGKWYNYKTFKAQEGGKWLTDTVTLEAIPVYIKEGSFITTNNKKIQNTEAYNTSDIAVTYFPSAQPSEYTLFDDDGSTNKSLEKNRYELIYFKAEGWRNGTAIHIKSNGGSFIGKPAQRSITLTIPGLEKKPALVSINGNKQAGKKDASSVEWMEQKKMVRISFVFTGKPVALKIQ